MLEARKKGPEKEGVVFNPRRRGEGGKEGERTVSPLLRVANFEAIRGKGPGGWDSLIMCSREKENLAMNSRWTDA